MFAGGDRDDPAGGRGNTDSDAPGNRRTAAEGQPIGGRKTGSDQAGQRTTKRRSRRR